MSPSCWAPMSEPPEERSTLTDRSTDETRDWAVTAARAADDKQATDVVVLQVGEVLALCAWFVIASAANDRPVKAICDEVEHQIRMSGGPKPKRIEGMADRAWALIDYGDVVCPRSPREVREVYDTEGDGKAGVEGK